MNDMCVYRFQRLHNFAHGPAPCRGPAVRAGDEGEGAPAVPEVHQDQQRAGDQHQPLAQAVIHVQDVGMGGVLLR